MVDYSKFASELGGEEVVDYSKIALDFGGEASRPIGEDDPSTTDGDRGEPPKTEDPTIMERYGNVVDKTTGRFQTIEEFGDDNPAMKVFLPTIVAGQVAGVLNDVTSEFIGELVPEKVQEWATSKINDFTDSEIGKSAIGAISKGKEFWDKWKEEFPNNAKIIESNMNVAMLLTYGKGGPQATKKIGKEVIDIVGDTARVTLRQKAPKTLRGMYEKSIRPQLIKFKPKHKEKYFKNVDDATRDIVANKENIKIVNKYNEQVTGVIPETVDEMAQGIEQLEKVIFKQYDDMARGADGAIDVSEITAELRNFAELDNIVAHAPEAADEAIKIANRLDDIGSITATQVQNRIQTLNAKLQAHMRNPSAVTQGDAMVHSIVVNKYRDLLYAHIENLTGKEYATLRNRYKALRAIQDDVNRAANRVANAPQKDFLDIGTDMFATHQAVAAITRADAPLLIAAATAKVTKDMAQHLKSSNRLVKKMFKTAEKNYNKTQPFKPKSTTGKVIKAVTQETDNYMR